MKVSARGICALARHEGIVPAPYLDSVGVWTWGVGHTAAAGAPDPAKMPRGMPADIEAAVRACLLQFAADLARYEAEVAAAVTVELAPHQFDALVSWHYNTGAVRRAKLTRELNAGRFVQAAEEFMRWTKNPELVGRRREEQALFLGSYPSGAVPVWAVSAAGRINWKKPIRMIGQAELLALMAPPAPVPVLDAQLEPAPAPPAPGRGWLKILIAALRGIWQKRSV